MTVSLHVEALRVPLGGRTIVQVDRLDLEGPAWVGIIGSNGSGKTTLLRALGGRLPIAAGGITIDGVPCASDRARRAMKIGFAPEIAALPAELTGCDVLSLVARPSGAAIGDPVLAPLREALGVETFWHRRIGTYSAGMRQRLAIFAGFVGGHRIVILDEPFNWLDPVSSFDVKIAVRGLAERSHLILTALHDVATFIHHCDSGYLLGDGRIRLQLDAEAIAGGKADFRAFEHRLIEQLRPPSSAPR